MHVIGMAPDVATVMLWGWLYSAGHHMNRVLPGYGRTVCRIPLPGTEARTRIIDENSSTALRVIHQFQADIQLFHTQRTDDIKKRYPGLQVKYNSQ
jgi:hypothetical protein